MHHVFFILVTLLPFSSSYLWYQAPIQSRDSQLTPNREVRTPAGAHAVLPCIPWERRSLFVTTDDIADDSTDTSLTLGDSHFTWIVTWPDRSTLTIPLNGKVTYRRRVCGQETPGNGSIATPTQTCRAPVTVDDDLEASGLRYQVNSTTGALNIGSVMLAEDDGVLAKCEVSIGDRTKDERHLHQFVYLHLVQACQPEPDPLVEVNNPCKFGGGCRLEPIKASNFTEVLSPDATELVCNCSVYYTGRYCEVPKMSGKTVIFREVMFYSPLIIFYGLAVLCLLLWNVVLSAVKSKKPKTWRKGLDTDDEMKSAPSTATKWTVETISVTPSGPIPSPNVAQTALGPTVVQSGDGGLV